MSLVTACNEALSKIEKGQITALTETSIEAQYCTLLYQPLLDEMADWTAWPSLITRAALAGVTNDRPAEWLYAYAVPADYGEPIAVRAVESDLTSAPTIGGALTLPYQDRYTLSFIVEGDVIYTNVEDATLVYSKSELTVSDFTPKMRRAFVDELAARLAPPVAKWGAAKVKTLKDEAMMAKYEAIADAENKTPRQQPNHVSMAEFAREGYFE